MGRVTLKQIAAQLGLSTFAVSRSLSGKDGVSATTRRLVAEAAARLGYTKPPSAAPRDVGVVFHDRDDINTELRMQIQNGLQREAGRLNVQVRLHWTHASHQIAELARNSAGLLLVGPHDRAAIAEVAAAGLPVVRLGWVDPLEQADQVISTDHEGGQAVMEHLIALGHRCVAFVAGMSGLRGREERFQGARDVAERHATATLHRMHFNEQGGFTDAFHRLRDAGVHPTAFFCANDGLALTVVSELLSLGYRIPDDLSVVGFGDYSAATQISPQLTTVRVNGVEMGAVALRLLLERIETGRAPQPPARRILIACKIIERRSAGPCRAG